MTLTFKTKALCLINNLQWVEHILPDNTVRNYSYLAVTGDSFHY